MFDEKTQTFVDEDEVEIDIEHSLWTISKWEEDYCKPFLTDKITEEDLITYFPYMDLSGNLNDRVLNRIKNDSASMQILIDYINAPHTATTFSKKSEKGYGRGKKEVLTAELIYYYMIAMDIPFECEHWHLNKLMTLIHICGIKNDPKKMSKRDTAAHYAALNKARRGKM
jgi:hypothetical protein